MEARNRLKSLRIAAFVIILYPTMILVYDVLCFIRTEKMISSIEERIHESDSTLLDQINKMDNIKIQLDSISNTYKQTIWEKIKN